jgi:hypothetical protein
MEHVLLGQCMSWLNQVTQSCTIVRQKASSHTVLTTSMTATFISSQSIQTMSTVCDTSNMSLASRRTACRTPRQAARAKRRADRHFVGQCVCCFAIAIGITKSHDLAHFACCFSSSSHCLTHIKLRSLRSVIATFIRFWGQCVTWGKILWAGKS